MEGALSEPIGPATDNKSDNEGELTIATLLNIVGLPYAQLKSLCSKMSIIRDQKTAEVQRTNRILSMLQEELKSRQG